MKLNPGLYQTFWTPCLHQLPKLSWKKNKSWFRGYQAWGKNTKPHI